MALEYDRGIAAAEAERIAGRNIDAPMAGDVRYIVKVAVGIRIFVIDGRRQDVVADGQAAGGDLGGPTRALQMTQRGFGGADRQFVGAVAKNFLDDNGLGFIAERR